MTSSLRRRDCLGLYPKNANRIAISNKEIDAVIQQEIVMGKGNHKIQDPVDKRVAMKLKTQVFNDNMQQILKVNVIVIFYFIFFIN